MSNVAAVLRVALWLLLVPSGVFAIYLLFVGLTFGFSLWNPANPLPTLLWLGVLMAPVLIAFTLRERQMSSAMLAVSFFASGLLDAFWIVPALGR